MRGRIEAIVSLPDHAFRKSGAQNKTSILFFRKFTTVEKIRADRIISESLDAGATLDNAIGNMLQQMPYKIFLAEAGHVGYTTTGASSDLNDLYNGAEGGFLNREQEGSILGEYRKFQEQPDNYGGRRLPDCIALDSRAVWDAHPSHRLDPKYHLFKHEELEAIPDGWRQERIGAVMRRREEVVHPENAPDQEVQVMTISQTGEIRRRAAGKGRNPPEWLGMYFEESPSTWYQARQGDVVYSSIDLWKGCVAVVPEAMDHALVTKEFPIYEVTDENLDPDFLSILLRSRYYQRAFRAITTGHSNRRRTQSEDFENLEIAYPPNRIEQRELIEEIMVARNAHRGATGKLAEELLKFSDLIDGRGDEELPDLEDPVAEERPDDQ
ncbi:hypothetical protein [Rhizobium sp. Root482]|uniref:hypothetical protein n=1 Tax=Rhizobium sp. Root482 TaxID=1736543 RepID=UPI0007019BB4|nr:hypothetical protein [Rhizobium sp. Root482]KQY13679.1 hypothetical protein ASD31_10780 [Rhizobium sp. Root482]